MEFQEFNDILEPQVGYSLFKKDIQGHIIINTHGNPELTEQGYIITHENGPLQVIAGPGSGKTETLVLKTLYLLFVRDVKPKSIIVTTFTEKAAKNLKDRIITYAEHLFTEYPELQESVDIYNIRIGTLHSLCNDIMLEYRSPDYQNYRLMDDFEQFLFVFEQSSFVDQHEYFFPVYENFSYLFEKYDPVSGYRGWNDHTFHPNKWALTKAAVNLFNRISEYRIDVNLMREGDPAWTLLAEAFEQYQTQLHTKQRCDFSTLQTKFLNFLSSPSGQLFVNGDPENLEMYPRIEYVMVDEYQDTNPIQEMIYFTLTNNAPHNICVVGDDDQALYRFRGGTVECMVNFDQKCIHEWTIHCTPRYLNINYRSHPNIVAYCDAYINSFPAMDIVGARVQDKPPLQPGSSIRGNYPAVSCIRTGTKVNTATQFAALVRWLHDHQKIQDFNQCALLMKSVRESSHHALPYADALRAQGIIPYNPRSRQFLNEEEIAAALGAFISIIDPTLQGLQYIHAGQAIRDNLENQIRQWINEYRRVASTSYELYYYVTHSQLHIHDKRAGEKLQLSMAEIFYLILSRQPFTIWKDDPERTYRLGKLSNLFEQFSAIPFVENDRQSHRGEIWASSDGGAVSRRWLKNFYRLFVTRLMAYGMNDPEDEEMIAPPNRLPIMTVHQAKGLEFDFVFVAGLSLREDADDESILLESDLEPYRQDENFNHIDLQDKSAQDIIRFYFVAYSRAKYALIHLLTQSEIRVKRDGTNDIGLGIIGKSRPLFRQHVREIR